MKKVYLLVSGLLLLAAGAANAQVDAERAYLPYKKLDRTQVTKIGHVSDDRDPGDILASDDFSDPANWTISTLDGTTPEWEIVTTEPGDFDGFIGDMASTTEANGFGAFNGIQYLLAGTVPPQNAVLQYGSTVDCSGATAVTLTFEQRYRAFNADRTLVEVSNDGSAWTTYEINTEEPTNGPDVQETVVIDITDAAAGESTVYVRFRWEELAGDDAFGAGYGWMVDDFAIQEAWDFDQNLSTAFHRSGVGIFLANGMEYFQIPESQATDIFFAGITENLGGVVQVGAKLNVDVTGAGTFSATSATVDLPVSGRDSLFTTDGFVPSAAGDYNTTIWVDSDNPEEATFNDTVILSPIQYGGDIYTRDNGLSFAGISNVTSNTGAPLLIGNVMDFFGDAEIGAIDIVMSDAATNVGKLIFGQVMILDAGSGTFIYETQTDDHEVTAGENGGIIKLFLEDPVSVSDGTTILLLAGHYGGDDEAEFRLAQGTDEQSVLGYTSGATDPFFLASPSAVMVRADLRSYVGIEEDVANNFSVSQNVPNPFASNSVINYELNEAAAVSVEFVDLTGKVVKTINNGTQDAGTYTINIDGNDFAEGVYMYTFTVGDKKVTKRMTITK